MKKMIRHPFTRDEVTIDGNDVLGKDGKKIADYDANANLLDWIHYLQFPTLSGDVIGEIEKYDSWATKNDGNKFEPIDVNTFNIDQEELYLNNQYLGDLGIKMSEITKGANILDIGGSCMDAWRFLANGAKSIHHVEVSKKSQLLGRSRIEGKLGSAYAQKITFHTCPAEFLPFADQSFDVVFSRSSIHHTERRFSIEQVQRVLRHGGKMLLMEPIQLTVVNKAMHIGRELRKADRGTDNPLTKPDIEKIKSLFKYMKISPDNVFSQNAKLIASWFLKQKNPAVPVIYAIK